MGITILTLLAVLALLWFVFRHAPHPEILSSQPSKWLLYAALILMGLFAAILLYIAVRALGSGDLNGLGLLVLGFLVFIMLLLAWRRPREAGISLLVLGLLSSLYFSLATMQGGRSFEFSSLLMGVPSLLAGILLIAAIVLAGRK